VLLEIHELEKIPVDPDEVYYLEAEGERTLVRFRGARRLRDQRALGELLPLFEPHGFVRIHRNHAVNLAHVRLIRRRKGVDDWEAKLKPPVNRLLPVSRARLKTLLQAFGNHP
jgi:DNA-binding LytR/AlgR family response regulator